MIQYNPKSWFGLIFKFHKSHTFRQMSWVLVAYAFLCLAFVFVELHWRDVIGFKSTTLIHSLLGFVIGLLLVFRTNSAYDRWWEGRKQWGALVNISRNLAIKLNSILPDEDHELKKYFSNSIINFVFALKEHLRNGVLAHELKDGAYTDLELIMSAKHVPNAISKELQTKIHKLYKEGKITGDQLIIIDKELKAMIDILGACERIGNTPIPYSYNLFLKKFIFIYTITLPLGLVFEFNYWTVPICTFILYVYGSLEIIAEEIEDPFGHDHNDLPLDELASKIKSNVREILG